MFIFRGSPRPPWPPTVHRPPSTAILVLSAFWHNCTWYLCFQWILCGRECGGQGGWPPSRSCGGPGVHRHWLDKNKHYPGLVWPVKKLDKNIIFLAEKYFCKDDKPKLFSPWFWINDYCFAGAGRWEQRAPEHYQESVDYKLTHFWSMRRSLERKPSVSWDRTLSV